MDRQIKNIAWLALTALLESLQLMIIIALIGSFIPIPVDNFYYTLFPFIRRGLYQKRDILYYEIFVSAAIVLQTGLLFIYRKFLNESQAMSKVRSWLTMSVIILIPQLFLIYQVWLGPNFQLARLALCAVCALAVAARVFWPEVYSLLRTIVSARYEGLRCRMFTSSFFKWKNIEIFWQRHRDAIVLAFLSCAFCIQAYLYVFAVRGWCYHLEVWPSSDPWNYVILAVLCLVVSIAAVLIWARRGILAGAAKCYDVRAIVEGLTAFFLLNALFELHVYYYQPQLAQRAYAILLVIAALLKIGWPSIERFLRVMYGMLMDDRNHSALKMMVNAAFIVFIFLFLYIPDLEAAIARIYMGEQFHGIDASLMNTGWAYHAGCKLNVDVNNRYGLGEAVMVSKLADFLGGFTYLNVFTIVMLACIVYFIAAYGLLRWWLKSVPIAVAGILMCLKLQPFSKGETVSIYLTNPTHTVCRYFFDLPFLFFILLFLRTFKKHFLLAAAAMCATALFYSADTGVYLSSGYYAFLILVYTFKDTRVKVYAGGKDIKFAAALVLIPPLGALALLRLTQGPAVFTAQFWHHMTEYISAQMWFGPVHLWEILRGHEVWLFWMGRWIVVAYIFTMLFIGGLVFLRKISHEHLFIVVLCIYGLALFTYQVLESCATNGYTGIFPYVFIFCFWVQIWAKRLSVLGRKKFYLVFLGLCLYNLWTTHLTMAYPNVFNFSRNPAVDPLVAPRLSEGRLRYFNNLFIQYPDAFKLAVNNLGETFEDWRTEDDFSTDEQLKEYYRREFNFPEDASLIDSLTKPDEPVALISSFEIQMLIQANRKPFFYVFPLVNSRPMRMRLFEVTHMWTFTKLNDTIKQLEEKKPAYVFMERVYLAKEIPRSFLYDMPAVCMLDNYVRQHYAPYAYGKYLVAMKLISQ